MVHYFCRMLRFENIEYFWLLLLVVLVIVLFIFAMLNKQSRLKKIEKMRRAIQLIQKLRSAGHKLVMISAKSTRNLELSMEHLQFEFDEVYGDASGQFETSFIREIKCLKA